MIPRTAFSRALTVVLAASFIAAACSSDSDEPDTTEPPTESSVAPTESSAPTESTEGGLTGEGLDIGVMAPAPGLLSTLFEGQARGIANAAADIDDGGGVLEGPARVTTVETPLAGSEAEVVPDLIADGADVLIGPAGSNAAIDVRNALAEEDAISCTASASVPGITSGQEQFGLFRTALPDNVLVSYLADEIAAVRDEVAPGDAARITIVARADAYGYALGSGLAASLEVRGLTPTVVNYNPRRVAFAGLGDEVEATDPDFTVLVTYAEGASLLTELLRTGIPADRMLGLDAFFSPRIITRSAPGGDVALVNGFRMLGTIGTKAFLDRLIEEDPNGQISYAAQAYDCAVTLALASQAVADGASEDMTAAVREVTADGVPCSTYADCLAQLTAGEDIDYDGVSGLLAIDEDGDPTSGRFTTAQVLDGELTEVNTTDVDLAQLEREAEIFATASLNTRLQLALSFLGFYDGPINGLDTPEFRAAMAAFQVSVGLPPTGTLDAATYTALVEALGANAALLTQSVTDMQILLTELGFYDGPIDGQWSEELADSVRALQRELGVPETGVLDAATIQAIFDAGVAAGSTTTTAAPTTAPPATAAPTTAPPATAPPATPPPVTAPPATAPPATPPPTAPPTTPPPTAPPTTAPIDPPDPDLDNLYDTLRANPEFSMFVQLLDTFDFRALFVDGIPPYTVLAPTNAAFESSDLDFDELLASPDQLAQVLPYYVGEGGAFSSTELPNPFPTVYGLPLTVAGSGESLTIGGSRVSVELRDIEASNGIIQGLDELLPPPPAVEE